MFSNTKKVKTIRKKQGAEDKLVEIEVSNKVRKSLKVLTERHKLTYDLAVEQLINFWELKYFDLLIERIKDKYNKGLNAKELTQLTILYTLLQHIDDRIGLGKRNR